MQSDAVEAERRGILRGGGDASTRQRWLEWMSEEVPFLASDRPWERATVIVAGTSEVHDDPSREVILAAR